MIPKYWHLKWDEIKFYSNLEKLSQKEKEIFSELEKEQTIIIDWIDYSN